MFHLIQSNTALGDIANATSEVWINSISISQWSPFNKKLVTRDRAQPTHQIKVKIHHYGLTEPGRNHEELMSKWKDLVDEIWIWRVTPLPTTIYHLSQRTNPVNWISKSYPICFNEGTRCPKVWNPWWVRVDVHNDKSLCQGLTVRSCLSSDEGLISTHWTQTAWNPMSSISLFISI